MIDPPTPVGGADLPRSHANQKEDQLLDATDASGYRAVIKNGDIYLPDANRLPGEIILVDPAEPDDLDDPTVLSLDNDRRIRIDR
jgi:hypothetical protein